MSTGDIVNNASSPFTFSVSSDVHHGAEVKLLLTLSNGAGYNSVGYIGLEVAGKSLSAYGVDVAGSSQDVLTSGQTSTVHIELFNSGSTTALDISGQITSASPAIEILDNNLKLCFKFFPKPIPGSIIIKSLEKLFFSQIFILDSKKSNISNKTSL